MVLTEPNQFNKHKLIGLFFMVAKMYCENCPNRDSCTKICYDVERILHINSRLPSSHYKVVFVDATIIEKMHAKDMYFTLFENSDADEAAFKKLRDIIEQIPDARRRKGYQHISVKECLRMYYGIDGYSAMSQPKIAKIFKTTQSTISWSIRKAKKYLYNKLKYSI